MSAAPTITTISITLVLTTAGIDTGPFDLYSDVDSYATAFQIGVNKATLQSGYGTTAPIGTTTVRIKSTSALCPNYIDVVLLNQYTLTYSLLNDASNPSPYAILDIKINDVSPSGFPIGGSNPAEETTGLLTFNSNDKVYVYTQSYADPDTYIGSELSLDIANDSGYISVIYTDGSSASYEPKYFEYVKLPGEEWNNNVWLEAQAAAFL